MVASLCQKAQQVEPKYVNYGEAHHANDRDCKIFRHLQELRREKARQTKCREIQEHRSTATKK